MSEAKIRLSQPEQEIVLNTDFILTKRAVMEKIQVMFAALQVEQHAWLSLRRGIDDLIAQSPKISKGENYLGLPYLVLDYPRIFAQDDILAIRTLFRWGNYFSVTLHLSGMHKKRMDATLIRHFQQLQKQDFLIATGDDQWSHQLSEANYHPLTDIDESRFGAICTSSSFFKVSKKIALGDWENLPGKLLNAFKEAARPLITETME